MDILILGHNGMLGHMIKKYYITKNINVVTTEHRWPSDKFKNFIKNSNADVLVNCIAATVQKGYTEFKELNTQLPIWLAINFKNKILHPASDGEFSGDKNINGYYSKTCNKDAFDEYGISKIISSKSLEKYDNVKQIRTSIIGPELNKGSMLFSYIFNTTNNLNGIINHYWNGITSLEWAKLSLNIIYDWQFKDNVIQVGTECITKYNLIMLINEIFELNKNIIKINDIATINRCLKSDYIMPEIKNQLKELKQFYYGI